MKPEAREKTAFLCRYGSYQWQVLPMGLCNAPSTFQRIMNQVFWDLLDRGVLVYLDDIFIYSKTIEDHKKLLHEVFQRLKKYKLYLKATKCNLFLEKVAFLGHIVTSEGLSVDPSKVDTIKNWPLPRGVKDVQSFLGLANYYRRFVLRFSEIAAPLSRLTRKNIPFKWDKHC